MAKRAKKTRITDIECASALEYREFRCFAAKDPDRAGCRLLDDGRIEVTDNDRFAYILRLHSGKEVNPERNALAAFYAARDRNDDDGMVDAIKTARKLKSERVDTLLEDLAEWRYVRTARKFA